METEESKWRTGFVKLNIRDVKRMLNEEKDRGRTGMDEIIQKVNEAYPNPTTKEEAIHDFNDVRGTRANHSMPKFTIYDEEFRHLWNDKDVLIAATKSDWKAMTVASDDLNLGDDKDFMLKLVQTAENSLPLNLASERLRDDNQFMLEAEKISPRSIDFASERIQKMCDGKDPIETLERTITYEKLKTQLKPKTDEKPTQKLKI